MRARAASLAIALIALALVGCGGVSGGGDGSSSASPSVPDTSIARISAGGYHTCAIAQDGSVSCWGLGDSGQLGTGSTDTTGTPASVIAPAGIAFTEVAAGDAHTCAIATDGSVWCWGIDGDGTHDSLTAVGHAPERVALPDGARATTLDGYYHDCATLRDGSVWCWGRNDEGQLGDGTTTTSTRPVRVAFPDDVVAVQVVTGAYHSCALASDGSVWCWGQDLRQQLDGAATSDSSVPGRVDVPADTTFTGLTAGFNHTCGLTSDGAAWCWGEGTNGQLGDGASADVSAPVAVEMPSGVRFVSLDAGNAHTCAIADDGSVWCWGLGLAGGADQEGTNSAPVAVTLADAGTVVSLSAGGFHTCVITAAGAAWCWGDDSVGQLGSDTVGSVGVPVRVTGWEP